MSELLPAIFVFVLVIAVLLAAAALLISIIRAIFKSVTERKSRTLSNRILSRVRTSRYLDSFISCDLDAFQKSWSRALTRVRTSKDLDTAHDRVFTSDLYIVQMILGGVMQLSARMAQVLKEATGEDWLTSPAARFEFAVFNLFKVDYAAVDSRLSKQDRTTLLDNCERGIALRFERPMLDADREHLLQAIASRMDEYGRRAQGNTDLWDQMISVLNGASNKLLTSGPTQIHVEINPPLTITDFSYSSLLKNLMCRCDMELGGLHFLGFLLKLFETYPNIFAATKVQIREVWEKRS